jgi:hypothetical protein
MSANKKSAYPGAFHVSIELKASELLHFLRFRFKFLLDSFDVDVLDHRFCVLDLQALTSNR